MYSPALLVCLLIAVVSAHFPGFKYLNNHGYQAPEQSKYYGYGSSSHYGGAYGHGYGAGYEGGYGKGWASEEGGHYGNPQSYYPGYYGGHSSPFGYGEH